MGLYSNYALPSAYNASAYQSAVAAPAPYAADSRKVSTNQAIAHAARFDFDASGGLNEYELSVAARAAESTHSVLADLFHTFLSGGVHRKGLRPDHNQDREVGLDELVDLANHDGDYHTLSPDDFKKGFPGQTVDGGNSVYGNESGANGLQSMLIKMMMMMLSMLGGSSNATPYDAASSYSSASSSYNANAYANPYAALPSLSYPMDSVMSAYANPYADPYAANNSPYIINPYALY